MSMLLCRYTSTGPELQKARFVPTAHKGSTCEKVGRGSATMGEVSSGLPEDLCITDPATPRFHHRKVSKASRHSRAIAVKKGSWKVPRRPEVRSSRRSEKAPEAPSRSTPSTIQNPPQSVCNTPHYALS